MGFIAVKILIVVAIAVLENEAYSNIIELQWRLFKDDYGKTYQDEAEEMHRKTVFSENLKTIEEHNKQFEDGLVRHTLGITKFADLTPEEFRQRLTPMKPLPVSNYSVFSAPRTALPPSVDWRSKGAVAPVANQLSCGSCWAFASAGALEGQFFLKTGKLTAVSKQNLLDCAPNYGCLLGGYPILAFQDVISRGGIDSEESYPYEDQRGECRYNPQNSVGSVSEFRVIPKGSEHDLQAAVAFAGPIAVCIDASGFHLYDGKHVFDQPGCSTTEPNHAVLVVGYGSQNGKDYYIVKNSYGEDFGQKGYILMSRNKSNQCGIANMASYPVV